jgi:hypothetical protein
MRLTRDQIGNLSRRIVRGLLREEMIIAEKPEEVTDLLAQVIKADLETEDRLNEEVRKLLESYADDINRGMVNYQELFRKVKTKLARDRKMVL